MKKKSLTIIVLALVAVFIFTACAQPAAAPEEPTASAEESTPVEEPAASAEETAPAKEGGYTIGAACISLNAPIWIELMEYGDQCAAEYDSEVIWKSAESNLETQISLVEGFIEQGVDCIMIDPIDAVGIIPVIQEALEAGIPVITMGNLVEAGIDDETYNVCTTYPDVRDTAALTDLLIAVGGTDKTYVGVMGTVGNFVSDTRQKAFEDTCKAAGVEYLVADGNWDPTKTLKVTQDMVTQAGSNLGGIYNMDDSMALISLQGMPAGTPLAGHNGESAFFDKIESGEALATILIGGAHIGYYNVEAAIKLCQGEKLNHQIYLETFLVMSEETKKEYWDGSLAEKYPTLGVLTVEEAKVAATEAPSILESLE